MSADTDNSHGVALGLVDGDANLDAVFATESAGPGRVCLGNGSGGFACSDVGAQANDDIAVALGEFGAFAPSIFSDGFETGDTSAWSVTVPL